MSDHLIVAEIFHSLQGEGPLVGMPSAFVRLSGCNLRCNWCDTPYASWEPEGDAMDIDDILKAIEPFNSKHVVLTGGEPMISPLVADLASVLKRMDKHITIETSGTVSPDGIDCDLAVISPKLSNSSPDSRFSDSWRKRHERTRLNIDALNAWVANYEYAFKFVVVAENDMDEIEQLVADIATEIPDDKIMLMPEGISVEAIREHSGIVIKLCKERGFRYSPRLQIDLFGNKRGT